MRRNFIGITLLLEKKVIDKVGKFNADLRAMEDWELVLRIAKEYRIGYIDEALVDVYYSKNGVNSNIKNLATAQVYIYTKYLSGKRIRKSI